MREDISAVLFSEETIREKVRELGAVITRDYVRYRQGDRLKVRH